MRVTGDGYYAFSVNADDDHKVYIIKTLIAFIKIVISRTIMMNDLLFS